MSILDWFKSLFSKIERLISKLKPSTEKALELSTQLKAFLDSPTASAITALIPGSWDDLAKQEAQLALSYAIPLLQAENKCSADLECWANEVKSWPAPLQNATLMKYASLLLGYYDKFEHAEHEYDTVIQTSIAGDK
jgi:hypothetical protein